MDISQIKFIKAKIALLDEEKKQLIAKLKTIEETNSQARISSPLYTTSRCVFPKENIPAFEQQIKLFRSLFRGRDDVYWIKKSWIKPRRDCRKYPVFTVFDIEEIIKWRSTIK